MRKEMTVEEKAKSLKERYNRMKPLQSDSETLKEIFRKVEQEKNEFLEMHPDYKDYF